MDSLLYKKRRNLGDSASRDSQGVDCLKPQTFFASNAWFRVESAVFKHVVHFKTLALRDTGGYFIG